MCRCQDPFSIIKNTADCKQQTIKQKAHPQHIKPCQNIPRQICTCQQRKNRPCFRLHSPPSQHSRKKYQYTDHNSTDCQDSPYHSLSCAASFFNIFHHKRKQTDSRKKAQITVCRPDTCLYGKRFFPKQFRDIFCLSLSRTQYKQKQDRP